MSVCGASLCTLDIHCITYMHLSLTPTHTDAHTHMLQAASFVSEYLVEQLIFEEALDLCAKDQATAPLTREAISGCIVDGETVA